jgi:hypothetical protein
VNETKTENDLIREQGNGELTESLSSPDEVNLSDAAVNLNFIFNSFYSLVTVTLVYIPDL